MWWLDRPLSDEEKLQNKIKLIVSNWENEWINTVTWTWVTIHYDNFEIRIETNWDCKRLYHYCFVQFNWKVLYSSDNSQSDIDFLLDLAIIVYEKEKIVEQERKKLRQLKLKEEEENKKLNRQLLISDALTSLMGVELQKVSKEVKDELSTIFADVTRVKEITSELNTIRRRYSAGWI